VLAAARILSRDGGPPLSPKIAVTAAKKISREER
jgi:hypothetical protein